MPLSWYDPLEHRYYVEEEEWPGVTSVLTSAGHITQKWYRENGAAIDRGRRVHAYTALMDLRRVQDLDTGRRPSFQTGDIEGELEAYRAFTRRFRPQFLAIEEPRFGVGLGFRCAGRPDRQLVLNGVAATLEIKTGSPAEWHRLQTAGYQLLCGVGARWVLYLKPNGRYQLKAHTDPEDYWTFMRSLRQHWGEPA